MTVQVDLLPCALWAHEPVSLFPDRAVPIDWAWPPQYPDFLRPSVDEGLRQLGKRMEQELIFGRVPVVRSEDVKPGDAYLIQTGDLEVTDEPRVAKMTNIENPEPFTEADLIAAREKLHMALHMFDD